MKLPTIRRAALQVLDYGPGFTLGFSHVGDKLTALEGFTLGQSTLGQSTLGHFTVWRDYTAPVLAIGIDRGGELDGAAPSVDVGTLQATFKRAADPATDARIRPGRPIRVINRLTGLPVFTGKLTDANVTEHPTAADVTTVKASDAIKTHAATMRYGAVVEGGVGRETWAARIKRLCLHAGAPVDLPPETDTGYMLGDVVYESNLANHFDLACASVGALWWVDKAGTTRFAYRLPATIRATFTEAHYTGLDRAYDTARIVNTLEVTNHGRTKDEEGKWVADDVTTTHVEPTSVATWGEHEAKTDMSLWPHSAVTTRANQLLAAAAEPAQRVRTITVDTLASPVAAELDIGDMIHVTRKQTTYRCCVIGIAHQIGPNTWTTTLQLRHEGRTTQ